MVRPVDLQDNLAKTQVVERMNQIQKAHAEVGQKVAADALKEQAAQKTERTQASEKTDMLVIRKDEDEERKQKEQKKRNKRDRTDSDSEAPVEHLDLKG